MPDPVSLSGFIPGQVDRGGGSVPPRSPHPVRLAALLPRPLRGRGRCPGVPRGKPYPGHDKLPVRTSRAFTTGSLTVTRTVFEEDY